MNDLWTLGGLSWRELFKRTLKDSWEDEVFGQAARLAFYHFLALFPALLLAATILGRLAGTGSDLLKTLESLLGSILPARTFEMVTGFFAEINKGAARHTVWFAMFGSLWAALNGTWAMMSGLNVAYEVEERRSWWRVTLIGAGLTIALADTRVYLACSSPLQPENGDRHHAARRRFERRFGSVAGCAVAHSRRDVADRLLPGVPLRSESFRQKNALEHAGRGYRCDPLAVYFRTVPRLYGISGIQIRPGVRFRWSSCHPAPMVLLYGRHHSNRR